MFKKIANKLNLLPWKQERSPEIKSQTNSIWGDEKHA